VSRPAADIGAPYDARGHDWARHSAPVIVETFQSRAGALYLWQTGGGLASVFAVRGWLRHYAHSRPEPLPFRVLIYPDGGAEGPPMLAGSGEADGS
jgi:hypothetical protein